MRSAFRNPALVAGCLAAILGAPAHATSAQGAADSLPRIAFTNATLIDGTGAAPLAKQTIVVSRGVIDDIFETGSRELPAGVRAVDLAGKFVIPGLIDSNVHVATDPAGQDANAAASLRLALLGGLTSVRDMAGDALPGLHGEMELLVTRAGFTPLETITATTLNSALAIGSASKLGSVVPGKMADMVVLEPNPVSDIRNTRRISFVVRGGVIHQRTPSAKPSR